MPISSKTLSKTSLSADTTRESTRVAPSTPFLLGQGIYRLNTPGGSAQDSGFGLICVDSELVNGQPLVRETWLLHQPLGSRFAIQPIPVFTAAFADYGALRTELGPALIRSARWLLDPARLAITEEFPTPPIVGNPNGQLIEGSWEILHRPVVGSATGERRVGLAYVPPATPAAVTATASNSFCDNLDRVEAWARLGSGPVLTGAGTGELVFSHQVRFRSVSDLRAAYPPGVTIREALWRYRYTYR